jgi:menaquinone-dependent protoporphyrinogen oxidase
VLLSTCGGVLSTKAVRFVRPVRSGGPGFVPFLFPGFMSASEATDVGRMTDVSGNSLRAGLMDTTSAGNALTCAFSYDVSPGGGGRRSKHDRSCGYAHTHAGRHRRGGTFDPVMPLSRGATLVQEAMEMSVLVGYASKHGATGEIAERIAEILTLAGRHAEARRVQQAGDLGGYEGFVVGSAAYSTHWLKDATAFVMSNRDLLAHRPVWLFSTGPLGTDATDAKGVDLRTTAEPKEIPGFREAIHPRDHHVFFGALDPGRLTFAEKTLRKLPAARAMMPEGDFRDWTEIEVWARNIAEVLTQLDAGHVQEDP